MRSSSKNHDDAKSAELFLFRYVLEIEEAAHARRTSERAARQNLTGFRDFLTLGLAAQVRKPP
jgi:hypothetical protein